MVTKELSEVAVEFDCILSNSSSEIVSKIPEKFIQFIKSIKSPTYKFEYDNTKSLNEQNLKPKTRGLIALVYQDYICNETEKIEYIQKSNEFFKLQEAEKRNLYNPDNLFMHDPSTEKDVESNISEGLVEVKKQNIIQKIFKWIQNLFKF